MEQPQMSRCPRYLPWQNTVRSSSFARWFATYRAGAAFAVAVAFAVARAGAAFAVAVAFAVARAGAAFAVAALAVAVTVVGSRTKMIPFSLHV
jgi:hypothetical protein